MASNDCILWLSRILCLFYSNSFLDSEVLPWWDHAFQALCGLKTYDLREATTPVLGAEEGWLRMWQI